MITSLQCYMEKGLKYKSPTQVARVVSEHWCAENLYCVACSKERLVESPPNTKVVDFRCSNCAEMYQLKSQKTLNLARIVDGAYSAMLAAVKRNTAPNLVILNYTADWIVENLIVVPSLFFTESVLERRPPLGPHARRAGWIGCNIVLSNVPTDGKIALVREQRIIPAGVVRATYREYQKLERLRWSVRGWTLDILRIARNLGKREFALADIYRYEPELSALHPNNRNIKPKIRQQLQLLRDFGFVEFLGGAQYRLVEASPTDMPF